MLFISIGGLMATTSEIKLRCCKLGMLLFTMSNTLGKNNGLENLTRLALSLRNVPQPVQDINCIVCLVRQGYRASRGVIRARVVLITHNG